MQKNNKGNHTATATAPQPPPPLITSEEMWVQTFHTSARKPALARSSGTGRLTSLAANSPGRAGNASSPPRTPQKRCQHLPSHAQTRPSPTCPQENRRRSTSAPAYHWEQQRARGNSHPQAELLRHHPCEDRERCQHAYAPLRLKSREGCAPPTYRAPSRDSPPHPQRQKAQSTPRVCSLHARIQASPATAACTPHSSACKPRARHLEIAGTARHSTEGKRATGH
mmetsp:Transcript_10280/g.23232  ORF Transcript_10280/g.23232 Transcript_10280/m.23232 type:complete len:225 (-) Transcript_10280:229-903(-)